MKRLKFLFTALLLLCCTMAFAHDFEVDGIYYNITDATYKTVAVTYYGSSYHDVYNEYTGSVIIPESVVYNGKVYSVTSIGSSAFCDCSRLTSVTIPNSVTSIGYDAFRYCSGLNEVHISDLSAWCGIDFGRYTANPLFHANNLYLNGEKLTKLTIPDGIVEIKNYAFYDCDGLTSVTIPNSVTSIGEEAFYSCNGLTSVVIGNSVTSIGSSAFEGCSGLTSVTIGNSVTSIGNDAFNNCDGLTSITIPNSVTSIGNSAFNNCYALTSIVIGNSVTSIGEYAFGLCERLTSVTIGNSVTSIGKGAFHACHGLTSIEIPNSVTSIGSYAFNNCSGLTSITIPNSVTSIGSYAFYDCSGLTNVTIGTGVKNIYSVTFAKCSNLTDVYCLATSVPSTYSDAFNESYPEYMTLHVPAEAINSYKTTAPWSSFGNIVEITYTDIIDIPAKAVLVTSNNGTINITCSLEGESVELYTSDAMFIESTTIENGCATIGSGLSKGDIAIVKIGEKSIKIIIN